MLRHVPQAGGWNMCGQAEVAQVVNAAGDRRLSALQLARETGTDDGTFSDIDELIAMLGHYGLRAPRVVKQYAATIDWHRQVLAAGGVAITLVDYRALQNKAPGREGYRYGHFVTPVRIEGDTVWLHDPLRPTGPTPEPLSGFMAAINTPSLYRQRVGSNADGSARYEDRPNRPNVALEIRNVMQMNTISGINIDPRHPRGNPPASALAEFGWARFAYKVSLGRGNTDLAEPHAVYGPVLDGLRDAGIRPIVVLTHEAWGEQQGFDWGRMSTADWDRLVEGYIGMIRLIAARYAGRGITYQVWNEQDQASESAVGVPPSVYGVLFQRARSSLLHTDSTCRVITGGMVSGPERGVNYFKATGIGAVQDGIAFHAYLARAAGYGTSPSFREQIAAWSRLTGDLFITEWGQPGNYDATDAGLAAYANECLGQLTVRVKAANWFAWADGMHTSVGVVKPDGAKRLALLDALTGGVGKFPTGPDPVGEASEYFPVAGLVARLNVRRGPSTADAVVAIIGNGDRIKPLPEAETRGTDRWRKIGLLNGEVGWVHTLAAGRLRVDL